MSDRPDQHTGREATHGHLQLVEASNVEGVVNEVFDDGRDQSELMPWDETCEAIPQQAESGGEDEGSGDLASMRMRFGLTQKQAKFCMAMIRGVPTQAEAYQSAYDTENMMMSTVHREATALMRNHKITACLDWGMVLRESRELHTVGSRRSFVIERLGHEAIEAESDAARVGALVALGKSIGLFTDRIEAVEEDTRSSSEIMADLEAKLRGLFAVEDQPDSG